MHDQNYSGEGVEVNLARIVGVAKEGFLDFKLKVDPSKRWRIITYCKFGYDRRFAGQFGTLHQWDIPILKHIVAQAEERVCEVGRYGKPLNTCDNINTGVALAMLTSGLSLLFEARKKIHPQTTYRVGTVGSLTVSVVSEEPRKAFISILVLAPGSRNAAAGIRLDEKGFQRLKEAIRLIENTTEKLSA